MPTFEPMSVGGVLDNAFRLYKQNFLRFIAIVAVVQVPVALFSLVAQWLMGSFVHQGGAPGDGVQMAALLGGLGLLVVMVLFAIIGGNLSKAALVKSVSESYLGSEVTVSEAYRYVLPKLLTLILASFLVGLISGVGFLFCVVPGVIFMLWFALTTQAIVIEDLGVIGAMARSKELVKGNMGKVFLVGLVIGLIGFSLLFVGGVVTGGVQMALAQSAMDPETVKLIQLVISSLFNLTAQILAAPIGGAAMILLYYDLRIRKEGFDLDMLAQQFAGEGAASNAVQYEQ